MSIILKVSTEQMNTAASTIESELSNVRKSFDEIDGIMRRMTTYWEGEGATRYSLSYNNFKDEELVIMARISEQIRDLRDMSGVYSTAEKDATQIGTSLPNDVIS